MKSQAQKNDLMGLGYKLEIKSNVFEGITYPMGQMPFATITPEGAKLCQEGQFGLLPAWATQKHGGPSYARKWSTYNARSESIFERPTFRDSIKHRRAVIPVQSFLEVADLGQHDFKFQVLRNDRKTLYLAAIWDYNKPFNLLSCGIVTSGPMELVKEFHSRSPIILDEARIEAWLDPGMTSKDAIVEFLRVSDSKDLVIEREKETKPRQMSLT